MNSSESSNLPDDLPLTRSERNGRLFLQILFGCWIAVELLLGILIAARHDLGELVYIVVRQALTVGLMVACVRGRRWARLILTALVVVTLGILAFALWRSPTLILLGSIVYSVILLYALVFSRSVGAYLQSVAQHRHLTRDDSPGVHAEPQLENASVMPAPHG